jgi:hypothetical protein
MTLHHLTHTTIVEFDFRLPEAVRRLVALVGEFAAARRLETEMEMLDHREIADLASRF